MNCKQPIVLGDTLDFQLVASKDGVVWDISIGIVSIYFQDPTGVLTGPLSATITDGPNGKAHYQCTTSLLSLSGDWVYQWIVTVSGVTLKSSLIPLSVVPTLA